MDLDQERRQGDLCRQLVQHDGWKQVMAPWLKQVRDVSLSQLVVETDFDKVLRLQARLQVLGDLESFIDTTIEIGSEANRKLEEAELGRP